MVAIDEHTDTLPPVAAPVPDRDDSTRYLCAAAHLSPDYAEAAVAEMLVEPLRATAPSPGIDAGAVLTEAVAARVRVRLVAAVALVVGVVMAVLAPPLLAVWYLIALLATLPRLAGQLKDKRKVFGANMVLALVAVSVLGYFELDALEDVGGLALLPIVPLFAVFVANRVTVNRLIATRFQRRRGHQPSPSARLDSQLLSFSPGLTQRIKQRYLTADVFVAPSEASAAEWVPVVVHRGFEPFVGAGPAYKPWSMAIPLERNPHAEEYHPLTTARLVDAIGRELENLRNSVRLSPSGRFTRMISDDIVAISSDDLVEHMGAPEGMPFILDDRHRPYTHVSRARAMALRDEPVEWARHFRRFTVLTWDHDLIISVYLHVAMDESTLYVEWSPCVLRPINESFRDIDTRHHTAGRAIGQAFGDLLRFPAELAGGVGRLLTFSRQLKVESGLVNPDKYGALRSLREFAADDGVRSYFQRLDIDRYLKIMHTRAIRAMSALLRDSGYSRASLEQQAQAIVQNSVHIGGSVTGPVAVGMNPSIGDVDINVGGD
ncbi:hypothetical protein ACFQV2_24275 [Actinokineospora soli]|uniref:Uncharacterized protein n=1 Tax=Actinokineospora soli TaxID=1048753 RepID=A0ABW2TS05_9PSEU